MSVSAAGGAHLRLPSAYGWVRVYAGGEPPRNPEPQSTSFDNLKLPQPRAPFPRDLFHAAWGAARLPGSVPRCSRLPTRNELAPKRPDPCS